MKHTIPVTALLVLIFVCTQLIGLSITHQYLNDETLYIIEPPQVENQNLSFIPILLSILIGTGLLLLIIRMGLTKVWTVWFGLSIWIALLFALFPFYEKIVGGIAHSASYIAIFALIVGMLALLKMYWRNVFYQNVAELFIYGGIISLFFPIINIFSATVLLILISVYDMYAVWKSKHMVTLAKFQTESQLFAGLLIPYSKQTTTSKKSSGRTVSTAILGGGDIAFPLLFSTALLKDLSADFALASTVGATIGLALLLFSSKPGRFYPAMPFISAGCFVAAGLWWII